MPFETVLLDARYAVRMARRDWAFTAVATAALAIGIGVNTIVFTADKALVRRPLDARDAREMVNLALARDSGGASANFSYPDYVTYRNAARSFSGMIAFAMEELRLSHAGGVLRRRASAAGTRVGGTGPGGVSNIEFAGAFVVSENYFDVMGVAPMRGRTFGAIHRERLPNSHSVLISDNYWRTRFAGEGAALGRVVQLNGVPVTIIGIMPANFVGSGITEPDFWVPLSLEPALHGDPRWLEDPENPCCRLFGRLAPGVTIERARAEMKLLAARTRVLHDRHSDATKPATALVWPGSPFPLPLNYAGGLTTTLTMIMIAAAMVLAVACANVGGMQMARARSREDELRSRLSLGADRIRVVRQLLTESAVLGLLAGTVALLVTWAMDRAAATIAAGLLPDEFGPLVVDVTPDLQIFLFVLGVSLFASILFGLAPAIESSRASLASGLRGGTSGRRSRRIQNGLVAAQVALSLVLMIAGSTLIRSALNALRTDPGYNTRDVVDLELQFPESAQYTPARRLALLNELRAKIAAIPGVIAISSAGSSWFQTAVAAVDARSNGKRSMHYGWIEPGYFDTLGIPLLAGARFQERAGQPDRSIILSEAAARELWPGRNAIGRSVRLGPTDERRHDPREITADGAAWQVLGVVRDVRGFDFNGNDSREIYLPLPRERLDGHSLFIRTRSDTSRVIRGIDSALDSTDPEMLGTCSTLEEELRRSPSFMSSSAAAAIACTVGVLGLVLALMGIYGTVSYIVALRTREIGIRMAVGAQKRDILSLILGQSTRPVVVGLMSGMLLAVGATYLLRGVLFGIHGVDGFSFAVVSLLFLLTSLLAAYPACRRGMRVDPMVALRYE